MQAATLPPSLETKAAWPALEEAGCALPPTLPLPALQARSLPSKNQGSLMTALWDSGLGSLGKGSAAILKAESPKNFCAWGH